MDKKTIIGKDVIESLTIGMYEDSRFIYREYIQNAADQIDKARRDGLLEDGEIHINIDPEKRIISIEDDATGIQENSVSDILKNIAQSTKIRGVDKGFRGIGRLGGLGYCEKLIFETSYKGESRKSIMTWDASLLKKIINNRDMKEDASSVIDSVTTLDVRGEDSDKHYFKVSLIGVNNSDLLDVKAIRRYLSMVAPVAFSKSFVYSSKIYTELKNDDIKLDEYKTYINTDELLKGYSSYIYEGTEERNRRKIGEVIDVLFFKEYDQDSKLLYWGWYGITERNQSIPQINYARGFRLRKSNIQIGNEDTLARYHRDKRFQYYFIGEVHALHPDLIPNARRDNFLDNDIYKDYESKLKSYYYTHIHKLCYATSDVNSAFKAIENYKQIIEQYEKKKAEGFVDASEKQLLLDTLEKKSLDAKKAKEKIDSIKARNGDCQSPVSKIIDRNASRTKFNIEHDLDVEKGSKPVFRTDKLSKLNKEQRKFLSEIFSIIRNVLPKETAELLIEKIEEQYK